MIEYIDLHQSGFWIALGFLLLAIEILITGFSTIVFFFAGLGGILTGLAMMSGILPTTWLAGIATFGISSGVLSFVLWKPMRRIQENSTPQSQQHNDLMGLQFVVRDNITLMQPGSHKYSGITWRVEIDDDCGVERIAAGQKVEVTSAQVGVFKVKPL